MIWKRRGAKILAAFFNGYGGGFLTSLPANFLLMPELIKWEFIFTLPALSGLAMTWPQIAKILQEYSMENSEE